MKSETAKFHLKFFPKPYLKNIKNLVSKTDFELHITMV